MESIWSLLMTFPTAVWTLLLVPILGYWLMVMVGALDIDLLPFGGEDGDLDLGQGEPGGLASLLSLGQVPITVVVSLLVIKGWIISLIAQWLLPASLAGMLPLAVIGSAVLVGSAVLALWLTTHSARSLRPLFKVHTTRGHRHLIGQRVTITSSRVDGRFGTALHAVPDQPGVELSLNVACEVANELGQGSAAVITDFDVDTGTYTVRGIADLPCIPASTDAVEA